MMLDHRHLEISLFTIAAAGAAWLFAATIRGDEKREWSQWQHGPPVRRLEQPEAFTTGLAICRVASIFFAIAAVVGVIFFVAT
ncbi:hypothetical protein [Lichenifustis flavocetrariae]|uniref:Uncharacterized protein n=1 Tax=Lichenifustis flavocetrariae TaxID=2949735 RepID=A0AA42CNX1_9HYPH|nr:hypothetical protein [Lichenifustis flavocetrariae]MCW6513261.1 hypothetical protein [Lichenifustis flavocetrariae]